MKSQPSRWERSPEWKSDGSDPVASALRALKFTAEGPPLTRKDAVSVWSSFTERHTLKRPAECCEAKPGCIISSHFKTFGWLKTFGKERRRSGALVMDPLASGQHTQPTHTPTFQWLSFAYQDLTELPYEAILAQTDSLEVLDLSHNLLEENPALLVQLEKLSTLILDGNNYTAHVKFPYMPSVTTVCINKNKINNLPVFVEEVRQKFPRIRLLSMMNNEAAPSYFNGGTLTQYEDYRQYVISQIPGLEVLDDTEVLERERAQARRTYRLQHNSLSGRRRKDDSLRKHTHSQKRPNT